jgi:hypothetical protein
MHNSRECGYTLILLLVSTVTSAQAGEEFRTLVINDLSGKVVVMEVGGKTYVDLKRLVQIGHGSVDYQGNQIVVSLSCSGTDTPMKATEEDPSTSLRLSREFMKAGIEEISLLREWASSLANSLKNGYPVSENWVADYRARAQSGLGIVAAAVSTEGDRSGENLLKGEFEAVQEWSSKLLEARKSMDTAKYAVSPTALQKEPLSQKIVSCGRFLGQMLASGSFQDEASCH